MTQCRDGEPDEAVENRVKAEGDFYSNILD